MGEVSPNAIVVHNGYMAKSRLHTVIRCLAGWFYEHGWTQTPPDPKLRKNLKGIYKRGYEIRLSASPAELAQLKSLLVRAGFEPGKHFPKGRRLVVPLYGKEQVQRFLRTICRTSRS